MASIIDTNVRGLNNIRFFNSFLTLDNSNDATGDYSLGVTEFSYTNTSTTQTAFVGDLIINILDDGTWNMSQFGSIGTTLANGINIYHTSVTGSVRNNIVGTTYPIRKNADFLSYTTDVKLFNPGTGDTSFTVNLNFQKNRSNIILRKEDKIVVEVNDNFTDLTQQTFQINGFLAENANLLPIS